MHKAYKTRWFNKWAFKSNLSDESLCGAVDEMSRGLVDAGLGGGIVKKRVALPGRGKSGGARVLVATKKQDRWFFVHGFEKNEKDNVSDAQLISLKSYADDLLGLDDAKVSVMVNAGDLKEICNEKQPEAKKSDIGKRPRGRKGPA